jgi:hypothetical protein
MPRALSVRGRASLVAAAAVAIAGSARAEPGPCGPAATVRVDIEPRIDPATARRVVEQVLAEVSAQAEPDCGARSKTLIEVHWITRHRVHLAVRVQGAHYVELAERDLDLAVVNADGRSLAIAIAADELVAEARERLRIAAERAPERPAPAAVVPAPPAPPARRSRLSAGVGPAIAIDALGGDVLVGPDARAAFWTAPHLAFSARLGLRAAAAGLGAEPWAAVVGGARALVSPMALGPRRGAALAVGADLFALRTREGPLAVRAVPSAGLAGWVQAGPSLALVGDLGLGAALGGAGAGSSAAALALGASFGFVATF